MSAAEVKRRGLRVTIPSKRGRIQINLSQIVDKVLKVTIPSKRGRIQIPSFSPKLLTPDRHNPLEAGQDSDLISEIKKPN